jgi:hypothetical protein
MSNVQNLALFNSDKGLEYLPNNRERLHINIDEDFDCKFKASKIIQKEGLHRYEIEGEYGCYDYKN